MVYTEVRKHIKLEKLENKKKPLPEQYVLASGDGLGQDLYLHRVPIPAPLLPLPLN